MSHWSDKIETVKNFPKDGVDFRDITPVLEDFFSMNDMFMELARVAGDPEEVEKVVGIESRGFILGSVVALSLQVGFVPVRKNGKLPRSVWSKECSLEYGNAILDIHKDAIRPGEKVVIVDDVLATGGTAEATAKLVEQCGGEVLKMVFLIEIASLNGRKKLGGYDVQTLVQI